ncbi:NAD(P)/FAD-dependent oxidoreductase [Derxia gummosa]|uniref:NAD(P)/FAD-dependent oxidoreductase n=1 Tax=Derxia gummosa DSM 723 TaxID=1121388 RepID=A0A8B6X1K5_9BURK|nr:FAD-dependent oxidoreductase [Derxia gummosa]
MHYDIVIAGGGAGGLELAAALGRKLGRRLGPEKVLLVDRSLFHIWKPTLHEVAAGTLDIHQEGLNYSTLAQRNHFSFALGEVEGLDAPARTLKLKPIIDERGELVVPAREVSFTWGVLAIGSGSNFFGTPGATEHANVLEREADAEAFRKKLLTAFTRAAFAERKQLSVAIVGGGATGVELSAELLESHQVFLAGVGPQHRFRLDIAIVEAGPRILAGLPEKISRQATVALQQKNIRVLTGTKVEAIEHDRLKTSAGDIEAELIVWAAGIKASEGNVAFGLDTNRIHQFVVNRKLETSAPGVYAMGDCAACPLPPGESGHPSFVPARAQAAHQQASYLAKVLLARLKEQVTDEDFVYRDFGSLVSLGEHKGVGNLMGNLSGTNFFVEGLVAKWMYMSLHIAHHVAVLGYTHTAVLALARLLHKRVSGRLKLH